MFSLKSRRGFRVSRNQPTAGRKLAIRGEKGVKGEELLIIATGGECWLRSLGCNSAPAALGARLKLNRASQTPLSRVGNLLIRLAKST
jgi:hypothetical protein